MKPHPHGPRLIVMRGVGIAVSVVAGALVLVGCASGHSAASSSSVVTMRSSPTPLVSIGSPAPSDAAERSRVAVVTELAERLLAEMVLAVPAGSKELAGRQVGVLTAPLTSYDDDVIDVADSWTVPETADTVLTYVQNHLPAGLTSDGSGGGPVGAEVVFDRTPAGPADEGATVYVAVAPDAAGGTDLRVDVQDTWEPVRPALEQVPTGVTGATLVRRTGLTRTPPPPTTVTIHVGAVIARHIAALLNALPSEAGGPAGAGGGADTTITVRFDGDADSVQFVVAGGFYDAVTVRAASRPMPTLSGAGDVDNYLEGLF
jgi:hypothetical protein